MGGIVTLLNLNLVAIVTLVPDHVLIVFWFMFSVKLRVTMLLLLIFLTLVFVFFLVGSW